MAVRMLTNQPPFEDDVLRIVTSVAPFTMTSAERVAALCDGVRYIIKNGIPGGFVECGVWRGGSMMVVAKVLLSLGVEDRELYLYDTFEGMPEPGLEDVAFDGMSARAHLSAAERVPGRNVWAIASREDVERNMNGTNYPRELIHLVEGRVEDTIPGTLPGQISLLRLDTDWYSSTRHELMHLVPRIAPGGVLILDDYGHWEGARKAADEYFEDSGLPILLNRIDYTGRIGVIPAGK